MVKVRDHFQVTRKDRAAAHRVRNIKVSLNSKVPSVIYKIIMQILLCKNLEISISK